MTVGLFKGTRKALSSDLIWADDPDTASESLVYTALRSDGDSGHIERVSHPSQRIDTFTQSELSQGLIVYVHRGNGNLSIIYNEHTAMQNALGQSKSIRSRFMDFIIPRESPLVFVIHTALAED